MKQRFPVIILALTLILTAGCGIADRKVEEVSSDQESIEALTSNDTGQGQIKEEALPEEISQPEQEVVEEAPKEEKPQATSTNEHILFGFPSTDGIILYRQGYVVGHNNDKKVADWVSYHLTVEYLIKRTGRTDDFRSDPELPQGQRSELVDYRGSGYDRGHLAPAGDMTRSEEIMSESFLLSNMAPQVGVGFNRGIWRQLESKVRGWAEDRRNLYVMTGPIYADEGHETIGPNNVAVPTHFYKIVVSYTKSKGDLDAIAFILPNEKTSSSLLETFITTIDNVEDLTDLDFLHELNDTIENDLESLEAEMW